MKVGKYTIDISNQDKVLFPDEELTKKDLIDYYQEIAGIIIPHLRGRPLTFQRYPDGIGKSGFFQKEKPDYFPDWIGSEKLKRKEGGKIEMVVAEKRATLVYLANQASLVIHTWLSRASQPEYPDKMIFDLDPSEKNFEKVKECALKLKEFMEEEFDLPSFVMSTGSKGLHVATPIKKNMKFSEVKDFAKKMATLFADAYPDKYTVEIRKNKRENRIFIDYLRNEYAQTAVAPYSVRARKNATIAVPLSWNELAGFKSPESVTMGNILKRMAKKDDPWENFFDEAISLKTPARQMEKRMKSRN